MRTTLKRGIGRATAANGNGRAVLPPQPLPRIVPEPMRRYVQPEPPRRSTGRLFLRFLGWLVLALAIVVSGLGGGLYLYGHETLNALAPHSKSVIAATHDLKVPTASEPATALLIGYDARAGSDAFGAGASRSDTVMLVRADPQLHTLSLMSFPRDLQVPIYCKGVVQTTDRINSAWTRCNGAQGTLETVQKLTGIDVNYLITVDFHGFKLLVNKLKGVYINVDHRYINTVGGPGGFAKIDLEPGYQKLDGQQSLDFVRFRHTDSDLYRLARQQLFLDALKDRLATSLSIFKIPGIIGALKGSIEIGRGSGGAPGMSEIQAYAGLAYHMGGGHLFRVQIPNLQDCGFQNAQVCAQPSDVQAAVQSFEHPDVSLADRANAAALGRKPKPPKQTALKPSQISTLVLNGTTQAGFARDTSYKLAVAGYRTVQLPATILADAPTQDYTSSTIYYDSVQPNAKRAAAVLKATIGPNAEIAPLTPEIASYAQQAGNPLTVLVVGTSFSGELVNPEAHVVPVAEHRPPAVRDDPGLLQSSLQEIRRKVPFQLMLPHAIESSSHLAMLEPVRVFKPSAGNTELALTFVTGASNVYWNIIETDWTSAPIVRRPTAHVTLGGRRFDLFTVSGNIHMIALRHGGASYWVVNTLRDELSNETMLAIAKGLLPLGK